MGPGLDLRSFRTVSRDPSLFGYLWRSPKSLPERGKSRVPRPGAPSWQSSGATAGRPWPPPPSKSMTGARSPAGVWPGGLPASPKAPACPCETVVPDQCGENAIPHPPGNRAAI